MSRFASAYLPHALYSVAITSISIHLVSQKRTFSDERARVKAQISILESMSEHLQSDKPFSTEEFERMQRLARPQEQHVAEVQDKDAIGWKEVFLGRKKTGDEMSEWDKKDMEKGGPPLKQISMVSDSSNSATGIRQIEGVLRPDRRHTGIHVPTAEYTLRTTVQPIGSSTHVWQPSHPYGAE